MANYQIGDLISFSYPAIHKQDTQAHDKTPKVLVLHNNWQGNMHGLNFNYLTDNEINMIRMMLDPAFELKNKAALTRTAPHVVKEFDAIMERAQNTNITSPYVFYQQVIKPFIMPRSWDPYRRYRPEKMSNVKIIQSRPVLTGDVKKHLFSTFGDKFKNFRGPRIG